MKKVFRAGVAASLALLGTAGHAAQTAQQRPCLTSQEANALLLSVAPSVLRSVSETCSKTLPANAYLRTNGAGLAERYVAPAAAAKSAAIAAFNKVSGETTIDAMMFDMIMGSMIGEILVAKVKPEDCTKADRILGLLDPLPPENLSGLLVTFLEFSGTNDKKPSPLDICKSL
ncbi:MAG: hypothetical protein EOP62_18245 [Sphingomonadales bacterium]|nr:MAG: hypothetical protein EOP62_18245 [Sphingomonadales bacterium]